MRLILVALLPFLLQAQQKQPVSSLQEDCGVTFVFNTASSGAQAAGTVTSGSTGTTAVIDNRQAGCLDWLVTYSPNTAVATVSLAFQTATDVLGVPTTWSNYPGTLNSGINPNTAVTSGGAVTDATGPKFPFLRMNMTGITGAGGVVSGKLYGWKRRPSVVTIASGVCPGTVATPCVVVGPTAPGSPPTTSPVLVAGKDIAGNLQVVAVNPFGGVVPSAFSIALADAKSNSTNIPLSTDAGTGGQNSLTNLTYSYLFNGTTWDRQFICPNNKTVTLTDGTLTALVAVSGATVVRVCHAHASTSGGAETMSILQGTGVACAGATATIDSYLGVTAFSTDYAPTGALRTAASNGLCVQQSGGAQSTVVWISYAQF